MERRQCYECASYILLCNIDLIILLGDKICLLVMTVRVCSEILNYTDLLIKIPRYFAKKSFLWNCNDIILIFCVYFILFAVAISKVQSDCSRHGCC